MSVTAKQIISGLYASFFNRAPDSSGLTYWEGRASGASDFDTFNEISAGFAGHYKFSEIYDGMGNQEFVEAIYVNTLGSVGDTEGISFWTDSLGGDLSRSEMVASFVYEALNFDVNDPKWDSLSIEDKENASSRKNSITNKADTGVYFVDSFGDATNITNIDDLDNDEAYLASISILGGIDSSLSSVSLAKTISGTTLFGNDFVVSTIPYTDEYLSGSTFYIFAYDEELGEVDYGGDILATTFVDGVVSLFTQQEEFNFSYEILNSGILKFNYGDGDYDYEIGLKEDTEINALVALYANDISNIENNQLTYKQIEGTDQISYYFHDLNSALAFQEIHLIGVNDSVV